MAIAPTPNNSLFKGFTFDDVDSRDFGVYISGDAVFNAPERDVEMIEIPGRNGAYALDNGRFSNIEVTYPAGLFGTTEADFAEGISALRNALASRKGYCRLEDDYNPNEYRMAVYKSGLDVTPAMLKAGEFDIVFECKPQRFLKSGETAQSVASGGTLTNPTLFESRPLLQVWGYGDINLNDDTVTVYNVPIGDVLMDNGYTYAGSRGVDGERHLSTAQLNTGDSFIVSALNETLTLNAQGNLDCISVTYASVSGMTPTLRNKNNVSGGLVGVRFNPTAYSYGTSRIDSAIWSVTSTFSDNSTRTVQMHSEIEYDGDSTIILDTWPESGGSYLKTVLFGVEETSGYSTKSALGEPLYFDLDIGEGYIIENGEFIGVNSAVSFPAELPTLKAGANTITYDNTITQFKVVPRWWRV